MTEEKPSTVSMLSLIGGILMLVNALSIGINGGPIILSSFTISSPANIMDPNAPFWARVSFGFRGLAEGVWIPVWLISAIIVLYCSIMLYIKPIQRKIWGFLIILFSILSVVYGGGFIIGLILGVVGGAIGFEWPKSVKDTFFGKIIRAAKLDSTLYQNLKEDRTALKQAAYTIIFLNILSGLGCGFYSFITEKILKSGSLNIPFRALLLGEMFIDLPPFTPAIIYIGEAVLKWIILSILIYVVGVLLAGGKAKFDKVGAAVAFAYVPISLQFFMFFVLASKPHLAFTWPFAVVLLTNIWVVFVLIVAVKQTLEITLGKALGVVSLAGAIYLWVNQTFFMPLNIPYSIKFFFGPESLFLMVISFLVFLSALFGVFSKH